MGTNLASFLVLFSFFSHDKHSTNLTINDKSIDGVLGTRTPGGRMVGADESTQLWRHPIMEKLVIKWAIPGLLFFIFVFSIQLKANVQCKFLPMTGFELWISVIVSNCSTNWDTTTALEKLFICLQSLTHYIRRFPKIQMSTWIAFFCLAMKSTFTDFAFSKTAKTSGQTIDIVHFT